MPAVLNRAAKCRITTVPNVTATDDQQDFYLGEILVAPQHNRISLGESSLKLQPKVMAVLAYLARHQDRVISAEELMDELWKGRVVTQSSVQKSMNSLRNALAELVGDREFVAHFSKRGYQLVMPVRFVGAAAAETAAESPAKRIKFNAPMASPLIVALIVALIAVGFFWMGPKHQAIELPPQFHLTEFQSSTGFTNEVGRERNAEPHPDGERAAYVRDTKADSAVLSQIVIRDKEGHDWLLASAEGSWVSLAWSPSGRNLVAVDMRRAEGLPQSPDYYESPNYLYSFHIFTLDFSGRRLLEKNLLSQWQGVIENVTWWDENTLEFVASQGPDSRNERYRYVIAEQRLAMLNPLESGFTPQQSLVQEKRSAVVSRRGGDAQVEFLNAQQKIISVWPIGTHDVEVSWIPDGSGVLILEKDNSDLYTLYLNGDTSPIHFPREPSLGFSQPRYRVDGRSILMSAEANQASLHRLDLAGGIHTFSQGNYHNEVPRFSPDGNRIVFTSLRNNQHQLWTLHADKEERIALADKPVSKILWPENADFLLYKSGRSIWSYEFGGRAPRILLEKAARSEPLTYIPETQNLWMIKQVGDARNIWLKNLATEKEKQLTFGSVAGVLVRHDTVYFQYRNQSGLWKLSGDLAGAQTVSARLPRNSQLLRMTETGVYFVSGGACRESDIQYLDFNTDSVTIALGRTHTHVVTYDFHPAAGALQSDCNLPESNIVELHSKNPQR